MSMDATVSVNQNNDDQYLHWAREVLLTEGEALLNLANAIDRNISQAIKLLLQCRGSVIVSGMGKAGLIGQKIVATLASTGTRSHFLHPAEAMHGDLGRVHHEDIVLILSQSGRTGEIVQLLPSLREFGVPIIAITGNLQSPLANAATVAIGLGAIKEACPLGLAPTVSTTAMLAVGDALALVVSRVRGFKAEDFAKFHPGGSLGLKLSLVDDHLRPLSECRLANQQQTVREVFTLHRKSGRRCGAIMLLDTEGKLVGIFTDSDLARLLENQQDEALDQPISKVMTRQGKSVVTETRLILAVELMTKHKISELPVVDTNQKPIGLIDITDIVSLLPDEQLRQSSESEPTDETILPSTVPFIKQS